MDINIMQVGLLFTGLIILLFSGDFLVRGSIGLAQKLHIPPLVIGLTIVAFGTSAPELFVSINAVMAESPGIALGNIVGSNIANVLLVLGAPAMIYPIGCRLDGLGRNATTMLLATGCLLAIAYGTGGVNFTYGVALVAGILLYLGATGYRIVSTGKVDPVSEEFAEIEHGPENLIKITGYLIVGLVGLPVGASIMVENGAEIARQMNVREELIGLTIIAIGTSLPELAAVALSAIRKHPEVALGNIVGSNIFNILAVGGATGIAGGALFTDVALKLDLPVMAASALILSLFIYFGGRINRIWGSVLLALYGVYIFAVGRTAGLI